MWTTCTQCITFRSIGHNTGADPGFQVRGAHLKKLRRADESLIGFGNKLQNLY